MLSGDSHFFAVGEYFHAFRNWGGTGGCQQFGTFYLYHTNPAVSGHRKIRMVAQGGYPKIEFTCRFQNGSTFFYRNGHIVDF